MSSSTLQRWKTARRQIDVNLQSEVQLREYNSIVQRISADRPSNLLDWGCGWGQVSDLLVKAGLDVSSFDYSADVAHQGMHPLDRYPPLEACLSPDPIKLPYEDESFSAVLSCGVLEHVQDPDASLEEIKRVLKPGGTFYCYKLPNRYSYLERIAKLIGVYYHGEQPYDRIYTLDSARAILERHGFDVREARLMNMLPLTAFGRFPISFANFIWWLNVSLSRLPGLRLLATNVEAIATKPAR